MREEWFWTILKIHLDFGQNTSKLVNFVQVNGFHDFENMCLKYRTCGYFTVKKLVGLKFKRDLEEMGSNFKNIKSIKSRPTFFRLL